MLQAILLALFLTACTTVENDSSTNSNAILQNTRIDLHHPPTKAERDLQIARERKELVQKEAEFAAKIDELTAHREELYEKISQAFPECKSQRHCLSKLTKGSVKRFEEWREARMPLANVDAELGETEAKRDLWRRRFSLRERAIHNRYLVREIFEIPNQDSRIKSVHVHSLEVFPDRKRFSERLLEIADPSIVPLLVSDFDFRMLGKPIDEAALLVGFDVHVHEGERVKRYLVSMLVNRLDTYVRADGRHHEKSFSPIWATKLAEPGQGALRKETFCSLYSIASPVLFAKISAKAGCGAARDLQQEPGKRFQYEASNPGNWLLPIAYRAL